MRVTTSFGAMIAENMIASFAPERQADIRALAELQLGKRIVTTHVCPPIPDRNHDWCAHPEGEEELGRYGYGRTEQAAILDLVETLRADGRIP